MKSIVYRGGVVTFRIPSHWREEYSDFDGGMFYEDRPDSGTMRLKIILATAPWQLRYDSGMELLQIVAKLPEKAGIQNTKAVRRDGNAVLRYEEATVERGTPLTIVYWVVANPLPPLHARFATFSYTIPAKWKNEPRVRRELEMLENEIEAATFSSDVGVVPE